MRTQNIEQIHTAGGEFVRKFTNLLMELRLQTGIQRRSETLLKEFADAHPNLRASYISREVDATYFADGTYGWEAASRAQLQGLAIEGENLFEFLAFSNGLRMHATPLNTVVHVEEVWMEHAPDQPFNFRACLFHSYPATTMLCASTGEGQNLAHDFLVRLKYLRGF